MNNRGTRLRWRSQPSSYCATTLGELVAKFILPEETARHCGSTLWLWHMGREPGLLASRDVLGPKITLVGHDIDCLDAQNLARRLGGLLQQAHVQNIVGCS